MQANKAATIILIAAILGLSSGAMAGAWESDDRCIRLGNIAAGTAKQLAKGRSVEELNKETPDDEFVHRVVRNITEFVGLMELGEQDARKLVYMKCKASEYSPNAKEVREMRKR